jgi:hypothetical protein
MKKARSLAWYITRVVAVGFIVFGFATVYVEFTFFVKGQGTYQFHQLHLIAALTAILVGGVMIQRQDFVAVVTILKDAYTAIRPGIRIGGRRASDPESGSVAEKAVRRADRATADRDP